MDAGISEVDVHQIRVPSQEHAPDDLRIRPGRPKRAHGPNTLSARDGQVGFRLFEQLQISESDRALHFLEIWR